jgi:hypothetical protein
MGHSTKGQGGQMEIIIIIIIIIYIAKKGPR